MKQIYQPMAEIRKHHYIDITREKYYEKYHRYPDRIISLTRDILTTQGTNQMYLYKLRGVAFAAYAILTKGRNKNNSGEYEYVYDDRMIHLI
jgi:hypothetical protein